MTAVDALRDSLGELADALEGFEFRLPGPELAPREQSRAELVRSIREYLLPRLRDPEAPVVAVIVGPSGSGKSVLLNSLAGEIASQPGALRPTTRSPVVWAHRSNSRRYQSGFLAGLGGSDLKVVLGDDPLTKQLTIVDAPDFESVFPDSREVGEKVLAVADLCIFVASALRYADAAAWEFLDQVRRRGLPILFVLNRLGSDPETRKTILGDFAAMLKNRDLLLEADSSLIFDVSEQVLYPRRGGLHAEAVASIRRELSLISDPDLRREVVRQSTEGALAEAIVKVERIADGVREDRTIVGSLQTMADDAYAREVIECTNLIRDGRLVAMTGGEERAVVVRELAAALSRRAGVAARDAATQWDTVSEGKALLDIVPTLWRHGPDTPDLSTREAAAWVDGLEGLVAGSVRSARQRRKAAAQLATQALGAPSGPSGGKWQEVLGDENLKSEARQRLEGHLASVLAADVDRFGALTSRVNQPTGLPEMIRGLAAQVSTHAGEFYG